MAIDPISFPSNQAEKATGRFKAPFGMKTILLVDDDEFLRELFGHTLSKKGYYVIEADSGVEGFEKARKYLPDLILTDICMPGGDGATLLHEIRLDPKLKSKQIVVMSGKPDLLVPRTGTEEGADDFLMKPFSLKELLSCVQVRFSNASLCLHADDQTAALLTEPSCAFMGVPFSILPMIAPLPSNEAERLDALHRYDILDTAPELAFDDITLLASQICKTEIAMIRNARGSCHRSRPADGRRLGRVCPQDLPLFQCYSGQRRG